jgi:hypothetical protein
MYEVSGEKLPTLKVELNQFIRLESRVCFTVRLHPLFSGVIRDSFYYRARFDTAALINTTERERLRELYLRLFIANIVPHTRLFSVVVSVRESVF